MFSSVAHSTNAGSLHAVPHCKGDKSMMKLCCWGLALKSIFFILYFFIRLSTVKSYWGSAPLRVPWHALRLATSFILYACDLLFCCEVLPVKRGLEWNCCFCCKYLPRWVFWKEKHSGKRFKLTVLLERSGWRLFALPFATTQYQSVLSKGSYNGPNR